MIASDLQIRRMMFAMARWESSSSVCAEFCLPVVRRGTNARRQAWFTLLLLPSR